MYSTRIQSSMFQCLAECLVFAFPIFALILVVHRLYTRCHYGRLRLRMLHSGAQYRLSGQRDLTEMGAPRLPVYRRLPDDGFSARHLHLLDSVTK